MAAKKKPTRLIDTPEIDQPEVPTAKPVTFKHSFTEARTGRVIHVIKGVLVWEQDDGCTGIVICGREFSAVGTLEEITASLGLND